MTSLKTIEDFKVFYENTLKDQLKPIETERKALSQKLMFYALGLFFIFITIGSIASFIFQSSEIFFFLLFISLIAASVSFKLLTKDYSSQFKQKVIHSLIKFIDTSLDYNEHRMIDQNDYFESGLFKHSLDRYDGDDYISGRLGKTNIELSELHTQYKDVSYDSKGRRQEHWVSVFRGLFFIADFQKDFNGSTYVVPDFAERYLGRAGSWLQSHNGNYGELIKLEDPEFEREFAVYGSDQIEARYILSPALMQRIIEYRKRTHRKIHIAFVHSQIYVAIHHNTAMFEPNPFATLLDIKHILPYYEDLHMALSIVDELNLNTRIWSKV